MRATALMFAAALLVLAQPLAAQEAGDGAGSAKEKHEAPAMRGRVGSVSPDEARRAERARKRAAAAHKPAKTEAAKSEPVKTASPPPAAPREAAAPPHQDKPAPVKEARPKAPAAVPADADRSAPVKEAARPRERDDAEPAHPAQHQARASRKHRIAERARRDRRAHDRYAVDRPVRSRRIYVGMPPRWTPQVGSTVPRGVRLYPLPPGYYAPGPDYVYGASDGQPRWSYGPRPVYGAPYRPSLEEPDSGPEVE